MKQRLERQFTWSPMWFVCFFFFSQLRATQVGIVGWRKRRDDIHIYIREEDIQSMVLLLNLLLHSPLIK